MKIKLFPKQVLLTLLMSLVVSAFAFAGAQGEETAPNDSNMAVRTGVTESGQSVVCVVTTSEQPPVVKSSVVENGKVAAAIVTGSAVSPNVSDKKTATDYFFINCFLDDVHVSTYKVTLDSDGIFSVQ